MDSGNGFLFNVYDAAGLLWAIDEAMAFYRLAERSQKPADPAYH